MLDHTVLFGRCRLKNGQRIQVEQTRWKYIHVESSLEGGTFVRIMPSVYPDEPLKTAWKEPRTIKPDFVLIRNFPLDSHGDTFKAQVMGLLFAGLPCGKKSDLMRFHFSSIFFCLFFFLVFYIFMCILCVFISVFFFFD